MVPFNARQGSAQVSPSPEKTQKLKDKALTALNKLGDRDTQKNAIIELAAMTRVSIFHLRHRLSPEV